MLKDSVNLESSVAVISPSGVVSTSVVSTVRVVVAWLADICVVMSDTDISDIVCSGVVVSCGSRVYVDVVNAEVDIAEMRGVSL